jgi:hypothetical protein
LLQNEKSLISEPSTFVRGAPDAGLEAPVALSGRGGKQDTTACTAGKLTAVEALAFKARRGGRASIQPP